MAIDVRGYMERVPEMDRFLTIDELNAGQAQLAEQFPDIAQLRRVGSSQLGEPISMLSIGAEEGRPNALVFGMPHPNEPIGAMTVHHFSRLLCEDAALRDTLGYAWHFIPSVDPDGTRLNEGWFAGPYTRRHYSRHFYRPASDQQVEWTFPLIYKRAFFDRTLPETEMLMRAIDELRPAFMYSLHNAEYGGVYYYISRAAEELYDVLQEIPSWEGLALDLGEPEMPMLEPVAPAIYIMPGSDQMYEFVEQYGGDPAEQLAGGSSNDYTAKYGTFTLIVEMPYWDDPRSNDQTPADVRRRDMLLHGLDARQELIDTLKTAYAAVERDLKADSPFRTTIVDTLKWERSIEQTRRWAETNPDTDRPAKQAEVFSDRNVLHMFRLRAGGQFVRMLEGEVAIGNGTPAIREQLRAARERFERWSDEAEVEETGTVIPIRSLVSVQLGAALASAEHVLRENPR